MAGVSIRKLFMAGGALAVAAMAVAGFCLYQQGQASNEVVHANSARYASYMLADELRQSSDDLTRLARTYVVTGDPRWEQQYLEVLDIRNGKKPRPAQYEKIYWDFRAAGIDPGGTPGPAVSLNDLMREAGFTEQEFAKLKEAEANSNDLVRTETIAMNLVKGVHTEANGATRKGEPDTARARDMMHSAEYHAFKAKIMKPVNEFLILLDERTGARVAEAIAAKERWFALLVLSGLVLMAVILAMLFYVFRQVASSLKPAIAATDQMAAGNLAVPIPVQGVAEVAALLTSLGAMRDNLVQVVSSVRQNAESVASASTQIALGNNDLSGRTEQQAAALEETASSMDELSATVRQNADRASHANQLSMSASTVAVEGGESVAHMIETMKGINDSSRKIVDIIGVIDGIAFQTNILALNAAVEAARAGEQGRGFAVVAGEVRTLAQRSAEAAKEIKGLISSSVSQVEQGSALVDKAGATMNEVVTAIRRVTDIVGEISAASSEQAQGVGQVNEAVAQMDQSTQQNAALVEQSAAAADSLKGQAAQLVQTVAVFQLGDRTGASRSSSAPVASAPTVKATAPRTPAAPMRPAAAPVAKPAPKPAAPAAAAPKATTPAVTAPRAALAAPKKVAATATADGDWESF
jgi:methyl-accepting chemotaxis protein